MSGYTGASRISYVINTHMLQFTACVHDGSILLTVTNFAFQRESLWLICSEGEFGPRTLCLLLKGR